MIDVGEKAVTRRRAVAEGRIRMRPETARRILDGTMPKGNVLGMAEVAGITAAKNTSVILPLCHPLGLDAVRVSTAVDAEAGVVTVRCEALCSGKTGVEMEALTGASAALLSIWDLTKGIDPALVIGEVRLRLKEGGKSGRWLHPGMPDPDLDGGPSTPAGAAGLRSGRAEAGGSETGAAGLPSGRAEAGGSETGAAGLRSGRAEEVGSAEGRGPGTAVEVSGLGPERAEDFGSVRAERSSAPPARGGVEARESLEGIPCAALTISDRCSRGEAEDASGPEIEAFLRARGADLRGGAIVPDDAPAIQAAVRRAAGEGVELLVTTGGTGLGPRDVTPEALAPLFTRAVPGLGELLRSAGAAKTPMSWISRSTAGLVGGCLVVALPGSPRAVAEGLAALEPILGHAVEIARGGKSHPAGGAR